MTKFWYDGDGEILAITDDSVEDVAGATGFTNGENAPVHGDDVLVDGVWTPRVTAAAVKAEAERRILAIADRDRQRNLLAQATILVEKGRASWTAEELAAWDAGEAIWNSIRAIRAASDTIEAMDPLPADITADRHWPA